MKFTDQAREEFEIEPIVSEEVTSFVDRCLRVYRGKPPWINPDENIGTIGFARAICSETARLATLELEVTISGSERADWLQEQLEKVKPQLRQWVEYGCASGTVIFKPNLEDVNVFAPGEFDITDQANGKITGAVFYFQDRSEDGKKYYTRMEYHRFIEDEDRTLYRITNKCYEGHSENDISKEVSISKTPWKGLLEDVCIENIDRPLFGVFRTPQANNLDFNSPLGLPIFSDALQELKDLDIAYSRNSKEIFDSKRTVLLDSDAMLPGGGLEPKPQLLEHRRQELGLPDMVKNVTGDGTERFYQEINPTLNTDVRLTGLNALLSQIGYKCGYSNGYFVFNEKTGLATATQIESEQQRTIQLIKDIRSGLDHAVKGLVYALNAYADLYDFAPLGAYDEDEILHMADITANFEEDRQHHYALALQGHYPWEEYYVRFLKYSREEARRLLAMAKEEQKAPTLFGDMAEE